jgi:hypothetical protein
MSCAKREELCTASMAKTDGAAIKRLHVRRPIFSAFSGYGAASLTAVTARNVES